MASFKETSVSRPVPHMGTPVRQPQAQRSHSHSISLGAINANHRVTRRKSMSRRGTESTSIGATSGFSSYLSRGIHAASPDSIPGRKPSPVVIDENIAVEGSGQEDKHVATKNRNRRASEGSHLVRGEGKRVSKEIRCDQCGKGYKHSSCLTKHMWEHNPAWAVTSKLLISKHQQVQLLEAATVLVAMNQETADAAAEVTAAAAAAASVEETNEIESDMSSASPGASSDIHDGISSAETTPPPMDEDDEIELDEKPYIRNGSYSFNHPSAFSRSYQSVASSSYADNGSLHSPAFSHFRHSSIDTRPSTAETTGIHEEDSEASDLAAAIRLCNFGTPRSNAVAGSSDVPPVPPLPARYLSQQSGISNAGSLGVPGSNAAVFGSFSLDPSQSYKVSDERDVKMGDADRESRHRRNNDVDFGSRQMHDDDDDGVFGRMEE
ncbi:C2H2 finger domain protein, putative [Talaromyces stipitatus ATCC 10500]|uniref:C2H2 finger domain protein, putative n=1 Tax=Talaromyces stipitatus (strain ATCC 10500 / CBS 375.48 / QM 6759 / NRRL 1006) TaxID=441959 RepID=B8M6R8_TALSN|nr:C2H2 finger domain protein, putative [Talaromyces stipitatus ATCC 10500]EED20138.1 C2H2 finger domain protein, putative [Talaromyces stipitatus ATCC 10500]